MTRLGRLFLPVICGLAFTGLAQAAALNLPKEPWAGGPAYWAQFPQAKAAGWANPDFLPIATFWVDQCDAAGISADKAAGINTYVMVYDCARFDAMRASAMFAIPQAVMPGQGSETVGYYLADEPDMSLGPGRDQWTGKTIHDVVWNNCNPKNDAGGQCGFTALDKLKAKLPSDGRFRQWGGGKGVLFWHGKDRAADWLKGGWSDVFAADAYFYTDPDLCLASQGGTIIAGDWTSVTTALTPEQCVRASNYGRIIDRLAYLNTLAGKRQPLWAIIEVTPQNKSRTLSGPQIQGAVWSSLIHGATGVLYFAHSFGTCPDGNPHNVNVLRNACGAAVLPYVKATNISIHQLAPILNTQSYRWEFNPKLDTMLKQAADGTIYIFAQQKEGQSGNYEFKLPAAIRGPRTVEVPFEDRSVASSGGTFTDHFAAEHTTHIYKIAP